MRKFIYFVISLFICIFICYSNISFYIPISDNISNTYIIDYNILPKYNLDNTYKIDYNNYDSNNLDNYINNYHIVLDNGILSFNNIYKFNINNIKYYNYYYNSNIFKFIILTNDNKLYYYENNIFDIDDLINNIKYINNNSINIGKYCSNYKNHYFNNYIIFVYEDINHNIIDVDSLNNFYDERQYYLDLDLYQDNIIVNLDGSFSDKSINGYYLGDFISGDEHIIITSLGYVYKYLDSSNNTYDKYNKSNLVKVTYGNNIIKLYYGDNSIDEYYVTKFNMLSY